LKPPAAAPHAYFADWSVDATYAEVFIDATALVLPAIALRRLLLQKASFWGVRAGNLARLNLYFLSAVLFDILRSIGFEWAAYGLQVSVTLVFAAVGLMAGNLYFCPECNTLREAWSRLKSRTSLPLYEILVSPIHHRPTIGRGNIPNNTVSSCGKTSQASARKESDGNPFHDLVPLRHARHLPIRPGCTASCASSVHPGCMGIGVLDRVSPLLRYVYQ